MTALIFGNNGKSYMKSGDMIFGQSGVWARSGENVFGPDGKSVYGSGGIAFLQSGAVTRSGNLFFGPNGTYTLSGDVLFGPDGHTWTGVSPEDVPVIIADDC